jgi:hypothetical protein
VAFSHRAHARVLLVVSLAATGLVASSAPAAADFHLMKVDEVFAGTTSEPNADFVELEMQAPGQGNVSGHPLHLFDASGTRFDCIIPTDVPNTAQESPILFATTQAETALEIDADFTIPPMLDQASGAACFAGTVDCVSWGSFTGTTPSPAGTPFVGGIPPDKSIERTADANNSASDFVVVDPPGPDNNVGSLGAMTCQLFTGTGGGGGGAAFNLTNLKTRVKGGRAAVTGKVDPPAPGDQVKLTFFANGSALRKVAAKNATLNADSKFKKRFKVPGESTRCKVVVRFKGAKLGQRKFKC